MKGIRDTYPEQKGFNAKDIKFALYHENNILKYIGITFKRDFDAPAIIDFNEICQFTPFLIFNYRLRLNHIQARYNSDNFIYINYWDREEFNNPPEGKICLMLEFVEGDYANKQCSICKGSYTATNSSNHNKTKLHQFCQELGYENGKKAYEIHNSKK
jgi:hypothetical protein